MDIEIAYREKNRSGSASILLFVFSVIFIALSFFVNLLLGVSEVPGYMSSYAKARYLEANLYTPIYLSLVILVFSQIFRVFRNNRARVKVLFWVGVFFLVGMIGRLSNSA